MTVASPGGALRRERWTWIALLGFGIVVIGLTLLAASGGLRGSDQYWYVADTETLIQHLALVTNTVFPVALLGPDAVLPPPLIHNVLGTYLSVPPAVLAGPYGGWVILNLAATFGTALLIYLAARTVARPWAAVACAVLYPLLPVTFWHTSQPLTEASISFFAALAIYLLAIAGTRTSRWIALIGALGLLYLSRESYLPLLLAAPVAFLVIKVREGQVRLRDAVAPTVLVAAAAVGMVGLGSLLFAADNVTFSYTRLLHSAVPGTTSNMWFNFDLSPASLADHLPFDPGLLGAKLVDHLAEQFIRFDGPAFALFYWIFNGLAIVAIVMLWRCRRRPLQTRVIVGALAFVAIHFVTLTIFQNQARYTLPAIPGLLVVLAMALSEINVLSRTFAGRTTTIVIALTLVAILPMTALALVSRHDGLAQATVERDTSALLAAHVGPSEPMLIAYDGTPQVFAYAARPRLVLYLWPGYTDADVARLRRAFPARWLLVPAGSPLLATLGLDPSASVGDVDGPTGRWLLVDLGP